MVGSLHNNAAISQSQDNRERIKKKIKMGDRKKKKMKRRNFISFKKERRFDVCIDQKYQQCLKLKKQKIRHIAKLK